MDIASVIGLILCFAMMILGMITGTQGVSAVGNFYDLVSIFITFGGSFMIMLAMSKSPKDYLNNLGSFKLILKVMPASEGQTIKTIIDLSNVARKEGLLALEEAAGNVDDDFLKKGILLIVDGTDPELVRGILETELTCIGERHKKTAGFWDQLGAMGPAWGMIGTLIGLVNMLKNMSDPSSIGPQMAVALITTFYGSVLANWICAPVANKLKANSATEYMLKEIMIEGILSIQAGENPRVIEEKLKSFLSPVERKVLTEGSEGGDLDG